MIHLNLSPVQRVLLFLTLSLATFLIVLDYSIANISIPYIAGDLSVSTDQGVYVITSFAVGNAIGLAMTGWLAKRVGNVRLLCLSLATFTFFSWTCGASIDIVMLVVCRFLQGFVAGPMIPLSQSLILTTGNPQQRTRDLSIWSTIVITAPVVGPVLGGYISEWYHWPWIFYINIPIGILCTASIWLLMHKHESPKEKAPVDVIGFILLTLGVTALQILLDKGQQWDWLRSDVICTLMIVTIVSFVLLIIREINHPTPFLELKLFRFSNFTLSILCLAVSYALYFGSIVIVPLWLQEYMNYDAVWAGLAVSTIGIGPVLLSVFAPRIMALFGNINTLMLGFLIFAASCFYNAYFTPQVDVNTIALARFFFGLGMILYINPLFSMSVSQIPNPSLPSAMGIFHFIRAMVGGFGASLFTTLLERRTIFHHERIGEGLTLYNPLVPKDQDPQSLALLNQALDQQASVMTINDAFFLMAWLFVGLVVLLALWRFFRGPPPQAAPVHAGE